MMTEARLSTELPYPPGIVFTAITERLPEWHPHFRAVTPLTADPVRVGSKFHVRSTRIGEFDLEVLGYERDRLWKTAGYARFGLATHTYRLAPTATGTRLEQTTEGDASGFMKLLMPVLLRRSVRANAQALEKHLSTLGARRVSPTMNVD